MSIGTHFGNYVNMFTLQVQGASCIHLHAIFLLVSCTLTTIYMYSSSGTYWEIINVINVKNPMRCTLFETPFYSLKNILIKQNTIWNIWT